MNKTSIIILSYNTYRMTRECIESIRRFTPGGLYEIIVVDNGSKDDSLAYLKQQQDITLIANEQNKGFPAGCNQGIRVAEHGNDILLLNSDTIVTPHYLENLQTALYSDERVGAVGCITNSCSNLQQIETSYTSYQQIIEFAEKINHSNPRLWEIRPRLVGFCYLIKNQVQRQVGYLDEVFGLGNFEDDDYSLRITMAGYRLLLCRDTFIHHYGNASFARHEDEVQRGEREKSYEELFFRNEKIFLDKWQVTEDYYNIHNVVFDVDLPLEAAPRIFVAGCGMGYDLCYLKSKYPNAILSGATENWAEAALAGKNWDVCYCPDTERDIFTLLTGKYDYILLADAYKSYQDFDGYIARLMPYLTENGCINISEKK